MCDVVPVGSAYRIRLLSAVQQGDLRPDDQRATRYGGMVKLHEAPQALATPTGLYTTSPAREIVMPEQGSTARPSCEQCGAEVSERRRRFCSLRCVNLSRGARLATEWPLADRLWSRVDKSGGPESCWPWIGGSHHVQGYGQLKYLGRQLATHVLAWEIANGRPAPDGMLVRHVVCHNPPCCNPAHLAIGTDQDNVEDTRRDGRLPLGERCAAAQLTVESVREIRRRAAGGEPQRALGREFGVTQSAISLIVRRKKWRHVS